MKPSELDRAQVFFIGSLHFWMDLYSAFFPVYMVIAGLDPARAALITAVSSFLANGLQPAMGYWSDGIRGKLPIFLELAIGALASSLIGLTRSYALLFLLVLVGRLGFSLFHPGAANIAGAAGRGRGPLPAVLLPVHRPLRQP